VAAGCHQGADIASDSSALSPTFPCAVQDVIERNCIACHSNPPKAGAPMPLAADSEWHATLHGDSVIQLAMARIHAATQAMPPGGMSDADRAVLDAWLGSGAPEGSCGPTPAPGDAGVAPACAADTILQAPTPYAMGQVDNEYVCWGFDVTAATKRHVIGVLPKVDNADILHHMLVFQSQTAEDPTPHPCDSFGSGAWKMIGGWAPGGQPVLLPSEAGYPENAGTTHWVVQLHYNNVARRANQTDRSGFGLCTTDQLRPHDAGVVGFGALEFSIPPRARHAVSCDYALDDHFRGVHFFGITPHMHKLGGAFSMMRTPSGTTVPQKVLEGSFDFLEQRGDPLSIDVAPGDHIATRCEWTNTTDQTVPWGEGTANEMCFGFVAYYPAIPDEYTQFAGQQVPVFNWTSPADNLPELDPVRAQPGISITVPTCSEQNL
jgi:hypothetical protein